MGVVKKLLQYPSGKNNNENRLLLALLKMADKTGNTKLKKAFEAHLKETKNHNLNLEKLYGDLDILPSQKQKKGSNQS